MEVAASCAFQTSVRAGRIVEIVPGPTLADGLGGNPDPETITFAFIQQFVDRIDTVTEDDLSAAIVGLVDAEHLVTEGAGAAGVAALVGRRADVLGRRVAVIVTGSNIDRARLAALSVAAPTGGPAGTVGAKRPALRSNVRHLVPERRATRACQRQEALRVRIARNHAAAARAASTIIRMIHPVELRRRGWYPAATGLIGGAASLRTSRIAPTDRSSADSVTADS